MLYGKNIVVGVCGGIAAYKMVEVVSRLIKLNANVHVIMTKNSTEFVTPLTFRSISHNPVIIDMFDDPDIWEIKHISLADKADLIIVGPATANIIGKIANGIADDMLTTTIISTKSDVLFCPSMNTNMFNNKIVEKNIEKLKLLNYLIMEPDTGLLACGTSGKGRLPEPSAIIDEVIKYFTNIRDMKGIKILVTAGPTREYIDPVRYISNKSSGKMGYSIALAALKRGAEVILISGPVSIPPIPELTNIRVETAEEMYNEVIKNYRNCNIIAMVAAVSDFKCEDVLKSKIKKTDKMSINLVKNPDIAYELGKIKENRFLIGFCAETNELLQNAREKLKNKNFDMIVANDVTLNGAGFDVDTNIIKIIKKDGTCLDLEKMSKYKAANKILDEAIRANIKDLGGR